MTLIANCAIIATAKHDEMDEPLMTVKDMAVAMNTSEKTVRRRITAGELPVMRDGKIVRIRPADYRRYIASKLTFDH